MEDIRFGKVKAALFLFFIVVLIVGGYFLMEVFVRSENKNDFSEKNVASKSEQLKEDYRINDNEELIYFTNTEIKNEARNIIYQDVIFNFDSIYAKNLETTLNLETAELKESYKLISDQELTDEEKELIIYSESDVYSAKYNEYTRYFFKDYASLVKNTYTYDCFNGVKLEKQESYVFNVSSGSLLSKNKLLELYKISKDDIKESIKSKLDKEQSTIDGEDTIDIIETLNSIDNDDYNLYINKSGYLVISYIAKSVQEDYNDVIILN